MNYLKLLTEGVLTGIVCTISIRISISMIIDGRLGKHSRRKKKKRSSGQTLLEWFLYTRYEDIVPVIMIIWQIVTMTIYVLYCCATLVLHFAETGNSVFAIMKYVYYSFLLFHGIGSLCFTLTYKDFRAGGWKF